MCGLVLDSTYINYFEKLICNRLILSFLKDLPSRLCLNFDISYLIWLTWLLQFPMSSIRNWRNFSLQISCVISSCDKNIIFVCRWNITKLISAFSKSCSCISTDKYFVTSSSTSRGGAEIESMLVTDRTGQGAETRHWSDPDHVVAPLIFRSAANAKNLDFKPTRPQTFSRCFQQFPMFSSTSKFRFLKY